MSPPRISENDLHKSQGGTYCRLLFAVSLIYPIVKLNFESFVVNHIRKAKLSFVVCDQQCKAKLSGFRIRDLDVSPLSSPVLRS